MNATAERQINLAHHLGKRRGRHNQAAELLLLAAVDPGLSHDERAECYHQAGVYFTNSGRYDSARTRFRQARSLTDSPEMLGSIDRDEARLEAKLGIFTEALRLIKSAMEHHKDSLRLRIIDHGFEGRMHCKEAASSRPADLGKMRLGVSMMEQADNYLGNKAMWDDESDRARLQLYNLLHLAYWYSRTGSVSSRPAAQRALWLARRYGNPQHRLRAWLLYLGGWQAEDLFRRVLDAWQRTKPSS